MKVSLIKYPDNYYDLIYLSARKCRGVGPVDAANELVEKPSRATKLVDRLLSDDEMSPFEIGSFTFDIDGITRAASHQLVRHRLASYYQTSQRFVPIPELGTPLDKVFTMPGKIAANEIAAEIFKETMQTIHKAYYKLKTLVPAEDARSVLPNATKTSIIVHMNGRALIDFFRSRLCRMAQDEIRKMAEAMFTEVSVIFPAIFRIKYAMKCPRCASKKCRK